MTVKKIETTATDCITDILDNLSFDIIKLHGDLQKKLHTPDEYDENLADVLAFAKARAMLIITRQKCTPCKKSGKRCLWKV